MKFESSIKPEYILLDVQHIPSHPKITQILNWTRESSVTETRKQRPHILHQLTLDSQHLYNLNLEFSIAVFNLKQLKSLQYLSIDLALLLYSPRITCEFIVSLKRLKKLSVLYIHASTAQTPSSISEKMMNSLAEALNQTEYFHHNLKIKLSLWNEAGLDANEFGKIISSFSEVKRLTSADLTFEYTSYTQPHIHNLIVGFKESKSLTKLSITLIQFNSLRLKDIIESLLAIKSLKNSRIHLKKCNCRGSASSALHSLLPPLRKAVRTQNIELILEHSFSSLTAFGWNIFLGSIWNLHHKNRVRAKFIGKKSVCELFIFIIIFIVFTVGVLALSLLVSKKTAEKNEK